MLPSDVFANLKTEEIINEEVFEELDIGHSPSTIDNLNTSGYIFADNTEEDAQNVNNSEEGLNSVSTFDMADKREC